MKDNVIGVPQRVDACYVRPACRQQKADEGSSNFSEKFDRFGVCYASVLRLFTLQPSTRQVFSAGKANRLRATTRRTSLCILFDRQTIRSDRQLHRENFKPATRKTQTIGTFLTRKPRYPLEIARLSQNLV